MARGWLPVTVAEPGKAFAFRTLPEPIDITRRDSTTWRYTLAALKTELESRNSLATPKIQLRRA
jgi:hypothetical protein